MKMGELKITILIRDEIFILLFIWLALLI